MRCRGLNPRTLECESPLITTRPGLPPQTTFIYSRKCCIVRNGRIVARVVAAHHPAVVRRWTAVPRASVTSARVVEPAIDEAGGVEVVHEVEGNTRNEVRLCHEFLTVFARKSKVKFNKAGQTMICRNEH